jgi:hypothetical protein
VTIDDRSRHRDRHRRVPRAQDHHRDRGRPHGTRALRCP